MRVRWRRLSALGLVGALVISLSSAAAHAVADGALDPSFGNGGIALGIPTATNADEATAIAVQADGKIVAVGPSEVTLNGANDFAIERFDSSGHLDHSFSGDGLVFTPITVSTPTSQAAASAVAVQRDGKIVAAGKAYNGTDYDIAVVRYLSNGALDTTFGVGGIVTLGIGAHDDQATAVAVQSDGRIVVGGDFNNGLNYDMAVLRFNANGSLDSTFDGNGIATTTAVLGAYPDYANAMVIQRDGKIVLAGYTLYANDDTTLVRFDTNGHRDGSFDADGVRDDDFGGGFDGANSLVALSDGTLLEAGFAGSSMNLAWYGADGSPIASIEPTFAGSPINGAANKVAVQTDGKLVVLAYAGLVETVYRLLPNGTSDTSFANGGRFTSTADQLLGLALQPDRKIDVAGTGVVSSHPRFLVERIVSNAGVPAAPGGVHATANASRATVSWSAPANNGATITSYQVAASSGGPTVTTSGTQLSANFTGLTDGHHTFRVRARNGLGWGAWSAPSNIVTTSARSGYWMLGTDGHVYPFGNAGAFGSPPGPAIAIAPRHDGTGYWTVDARGHVGHFGKAANYGDSPALGAGEIVSTMSATPSAKGYWLFTNRGRALPYGDARFYGDMSAVHLNGPVVASVATPTGHGYYMVASDGGVFSFGDARFHGSTGNLPLNRPVVGISPTPDNHGYWLVASDGGVFAFDAPFRGSMGSTALARPVNGLVAYGTGYLMVASDGGVFDFSNQAFLGSLAAHPPAAPIIGIAAFTT